MATDVAKQAPKKDKDASDAAAKDENVFAAWRNKKETANAPGGGADGKLKPAGAGDRRRSNINSLNPKSMQRRMTIFMRAKSDVSADQLKPAVKKENTYKMKPDDGCTFSVARVRNVVSQIFEDDLSSVTYSNDTSSRIACELSEKIKDKVKDLNFNRYKVAVNVMVGQIGDQGMEVVSRCCWDHTTDNYVCVDYKNKSIFVIALVFGVYFE